MIIIIYYHSLFLWIRNLRMAWLGSSDSALMRLWSKCQPRLQFLKVWLGLENLLPRLPIHTADQLVLAIGGNPWFLFKGKFSCDLSFMNMATRFQSWTFWDRGSQAEAEVFCDLNFGSHMASFLLCSIVQGNPRTLLIQEEREHKTCLSLGGVPVIC